MKPTASRSQRPPQPGPGPSRVPGRAKPRPVAFYRELRRALLGPCRVRPEATLVVACSGGPDSLALLVGLHELSRTLRLRLVAAHLDHGVRAGSAADARAVARRAAALGVPCAVERVRGRREMRARGLSGEAGLRQLRREFLRRVARERGADAVVLGHTADDQAETLLLRLARGTGIRGLGGMRWRSGAWARPLLGVARAEVSEFLRDRRLRPRRDPTNLDLRRSRNLIRHRVLPTLARLNARAAEALAAAAERIGQVSAFLDRLGRRALARASAGPARGGVHLVRATLLRYHPCIRENVIRQAWEAVGPRTRGLTRRHLRAVEALLQQGIGGSVVHLPLDRLARLERGLLFLGTAAAPPATGKESA